MRRRDFVGGIVGLVVSHTAPSAAQSKARRIAIFHPSEAPERMTVNGHKTFIAFFSELQQQGYIEGSNLIVERYQLSAGLTPM
jgi:hypothetical protein